MKLIRDIIFLFFISAPHILFSQGVGNRMILDVLDPNQQNQGLIYNQGEYDDILGSPFFSEDWISANVLGQNEQKVEQVSLKYDIYKNRILIKRGDEVLELSNNIVMGFEFFKDGESYRFEKIEAVSDHKGYLRVIYEGEGLQAYERIAKILVEPSAIKDGYASTSKTKSRFVEKNYLILITKDGIKQDIKRNKRGICNAFPDKAKQINKFIKGEKLSTDKFADLTKIFQYIETQQN